MKKVLYTATVLSHICQFHKPYLKMLKDNGYTVHVAARNNLSEKNGLQLEHADRLFEMPFMRSPFSVKNIKAYKQLKKLIREEEYDLIVCNTPVGGIVTRLAASKARKRGTKVIYIAHGFHFYNGGPKKSWITYYPIEKHFAKKCDALITINDEDFLLAKSKFKTNVERIHGIGVSADRYFPIPHTEKVAKRQAMGYSVDAFLILVVGELLPNKNQIQAIKAVEHIVEKQKNAKLLIAGNGNNRSALEDYIFQKNLQDHIEFLGYCTHLEDYQQIVDVGVSCSIREGLGLNVIESMLSGNAFIATKNRGHCELIQDGVNGFLVDMNDWQTMAEKLSLLIENHELKLHLSSNARRLIKPYTLEETKKEMEEIFERYKRSN